MNEEGNIEVFGLSFWVRGGIKEGNTAEASLQW